MNLARKKKDHSYSVFCRSEEEISIDAHLESILASECTMIVLDTIETIIQVRPNP
jgi:hypothetical protein